MKTVKTSDYVKQIEKLGYTERHHNGKHRIFVAAGKSPLSIPNHRELSPGVQRSLNKLIK
jgi:predicted RNA binding protein YcfA (HicA-like mRNA interferase family)